MPSSNPFAEDMRQSRAARGHRNPFAPTPEQQSQVHEKRKPLQKQTQGVSRRASTKQRSHSTSSAASVGNSGVRRVNSYHSMSRARTIDNDSTKEDRARRRHSNNDSNSSNNTSSNSTSSNSNGYGNARPSVISADQGEGPTASAPASHTRFADYLRSRANIIQHRRRSTPNYDAGDRSRASKGNGRGSEAMGGRVVVQVDGSNGESVERNDSHTNAHIGPSKGAGSTGSVSGSTANGIGRPRRRSSRSSRARAAAPQPAQLHVVINSLTFASLATRALLGTAARLPVVHGLLLGHFVDETVSRTDDVREGVAEMKRTCVVHGLQVLPVTMQDVLTSRGAALHSIKPRVRQRAEKIGGGGGGRVGGSSNGLIRAVSDRFLSVIVCCCF